MGKTKNAGTQRERSHVLPAITNTRNFLKSKWPLVLGPIERPGKPSEENPGQQNKTAPLGPIKWPLPRELRKILLPCPFFFVSLPAVALPQTWPAPFLFLVCVSFFVADERMLAAKKCRYIHTVK